MKTLTARYGRRAPVWMAAVMLALAGCGGGAAAPNTPPKAAIALAAETAAPSLGADVVLSGAGSSDAQAGALSYAWSLQSKPADSAAVLSGPQTADVRFTPDRAGTYVVRLRVTDAAGATSEQDMTVAVANHVPVPVIDKNALTVLAGGVVTASAGLSYDVDGDTLSYSWSLDSKPADSSAAIGAAGAADVAFTPDRPGNYSLLVKVSDGKHPVMSRLDVRVLAQSAGTLALPFTPLDARYSKSLDQVVMVSAAPDALKIADPFGATIKTVLLPAPSKALTLSPDGRLAAVLHEGVLTLVDLVKAAVVRSSATNGAQTEVFLTNSGIAYLIGQTGGQWANPDVLVLDARSGAVLPAGGVNLGGYFYGTMHGVYSSVYNKALAVSAGLSPVDITYVSINPDTNAVAEVGDSPYHGDYPIGLQLFLSNKEEVVFTSAGTYFRTDKLTYMGKLNLNGALISLSQSSGQETLVLAASAGGYPDYASIYPAAYQRYTGALMQASGELTLPVINGLPSYGRNIFHSAAGYHVALVQTGGAGQNAAGLKFYLTYR
ncbi:PKD domain-containing protein [Rugamonas apoptosis]|uniref:PKD/Chitinase domain-containing protein n=1 Tax=Rugamonas apoptosis TaxID=2758570 RepID=A0A7W2FEV1_9BURK|nr:Ig-like domain-containing protein [Rugamonas apoptosis]MBA5690342.1 hypothetical protein [Rugamonas apoptosis]